MASTSRRAGVERPQALFKYLVPERIDFLSTRLLRLTPPGEFNDPFDASPVATFASDPVTLNTSNKSKTIGAQARELLQRFADNAFNRKSAAQHLLSQTHGVLALSERHDSLLMWAHYAKNHQGFVVKFRSNHCWFADAHQVVYSSDRPFVAPFARKRLNEGADDAIAFCLQKGVDWAYEQEWRVVRELAKADKSLTLPQSRAHLFCVPQEAIASVLIGARMPQETRDQLLRLLLAPANQRIRIVQARLSPRKFELEFHPLHRKSLARIAATAGR